MHAAGRRRPGRPAGARPIQNTPFTHRNHHDRRNPHERRNHLTNFVIECILSRSAAKYYDPAATLSDDQICELVRIGTTAPTSFHLHNWRFIAVRTPEAKARLRPIAWDQPAITEAAVAFIVCGKLADSSVIPGRLAPLVEAGIMPAKMMPDWEIPAWSTRSASATKQYAPAPSARRR